LDHIQFTSTTIIRKEFYMRRLLVLLVGTVLLAGSARAQVTFSGGPHAGIALSAFPDLVSQATAPNTLSDAYGLGYVFGAHGDVGFAEYLSGRLSLDYSLYPADKDKFKEGYTDQAGNPLPASDFNVEGGTVSFFSITVNGLGKIPTGSSVTPYGLLGFGMHIVTPSDVKTTYTPTNQQIEYMSEGETKFGVNFGAGVEFDLGSVNLFGEIKYVIVFTSEKSTGLIPVVVGVSFGG
jgi:opacity protein-like surface antigen